MKRLLRKKLISPLQRESAEIDPDQVMLDARNLPHLDEDQFEGRFERPISATSLRLVSVIFLIVALCYSFRLWDLQIRNGIAYAEKSENNHLQYSTIFADRGVIVDRNGVPLAWNESRPESDFPKRVYRNAPGSGHLIGYVSYPQKDNSGNYYQDKFIGKDGAEVFFDERLSGKNGLKIFETDASSRVQGDSTLERPEHGEKIVLAVDSRLQDLFSKHLEEMANKHEFSGGAAVIMDVTNGEIIALSSYPEYSPQKMSDGDRSAIVSYNSNKQTPFLNRVVGGLYTPGSIMKPYVALAALSENIISPDKKILSAGKIEIANPYKKGEKTTFLDWKAHGWVDMREALAVSSDVYFYEVGGGFEDQKGLGILNLEKYFNMFGFGRSTGLSFDSEKAGVISSPEWKAEHFNGEPWRIGDTYHTAIGQYGTQITPLQAVRAVASIANGGTLWTPRLEVVGEGESVKGEKVPISPSYFNVVREGMRKSAIDGTAKGLNTPVIKIAAKTGTAELGVSKDFVNSWTIGYFPYDKPKYAFAVLMEHGSKHNTVGAVAVMRQVIDDMARVTPEYFGLATSTAVLTKPTVQ